MSIQTKLATILIPFMFYGCGSSESVEAPNNEAITAKPEAEQAAANPEEKSENNREVGNSISRTKEAEAPSGDKPPITFAQAVEDLEQVLVLHPYLKLDQYRGGVYKKGGLILKPRFPSKSSLAEFMLSGVPTENAVDVSQGFVKLNKLMQRTATLAQKYVKVDEEKLPITGEEAKELAKDLTEIESENTKLYNSTYNSIVGLSPDARREFAYDVLLGMVNQNQTFITFLKHVVLGQKLPEGAKLAKGGK